MISSIKDPKIQFARKLNQKKLRDELKACILDNEQIISHILKKKLQKKIKFILKRENSILDKSLEILLSAEKQIVYKVSSGVFDKITTSPEKSNIIAIIKIFESDYSLPMNDMVLVLDQINDHGNIGSLIRTACAFSINKIILISRDNDFYYRKTILASRGLIFNTQNIVFEESSKAIDFLKKNKYKLITTSLDANNTVLSLKKMVTQKNIAIVVGNETLGVSKPLKEASDEKLKILMSEDVESLNVVVASGIILQKIYELKS